MELQIEGVEYEPVVMAPEDVKNDPACRRLTELGRILDWINREDIERRIRKFDWGPVIVLDSHGRKLIFTDKDETAVLLYRPVHPSDMEQIAQPLAEETLEGLSAKLLTAIFEHARGNVSSPQEVYELGKKLGLMSKSHINQVVDYLCQNGMLKSDAHDQLKRYANLTFSAALSMRRTNDKS